MVEALGLGEDFARKVLKGKHCYNSMRAYLYVAESISRMKLDFFLEWLYLHNKYHLYATVLKSDKVKVLRC